MKKTFCILLIFFSTLTFGQSELCIHLNSDTKIDSVSVTSLNLSGIFKSEFKNGIAIIKTTAKLSDQYSIFIDSKNVSGWFNSGKIDVYLDYKQDKLTISKTKNSPVYDKQVNYFKKYLEFLEDKSIGTNFIKDAILENDQDAFSLIPLNHYLKLNQNDINKIKFVQDFLDRQPQIIKEHTIFSMIQDRIVTLKETKRIKLDEYSFIDESGKLTKINKNPNAKYTVLDFWFTACPPCIKEHNEMLSNPRMFKELNAELIGISTDSEQKKWVNYLTKKNIDWKNYRIENNRIDKDLDIFSFPTYIILDKHNNVLGSYSNIADTIKALEE